MAMTALSQAKFQTGTNANTSSTQGKSNSSGVNSPNQTVTNETVLNNANGEKSKLKQAMNLWNKVIQNPRSEGKVNSLSNGRKSWAGEVYEELGQQGKKSSIWDEFDIAKLSNAGFKLEYVSPKVQGESQVGAIELEDITSEIDYWKNAIVCYVLDAHRPFVVIQ